MRSYFRPPMKCLTSCSACDEVNERGRESFLWRQRTSQFDDLPPPQKRLPTPSVRPSQLTPPRNAHYAWGSYREFPPQLAGVARMHRAFRVVVKSFVILAAAGTWNAALCAT